VLYPTLTDYDIRFYIFLLLKALDYRLVIFVVCVGD
jgi:hypothetical protein